MNPFLIVLIVIVALAIVFYVAPTIISVLFTLRGKRANVMTAETIKGTVSEPYAEKILRDIAFFSKLAMEDVTIKSSDGLKLHGKYLDAGSGRAAILVHGYHTNGMNNFASTARVLYEEMGMSLLFVDQRACGESEGRFTAFGLKERYDVRSWVRYLSKKPEIKSIALYGVSMGASSIAFTSDRIRSRKVKALILDCGFESAKDQMLLRGKQLHFPAQIMYPFVRLIGKIILREDFDENTVTHLAKASLPALFIHGTADSTVPFYEGENQYREYHGPKKRLFVEGAEHAVAVLSDFEKAKETIKSFLNEYMDKEIEEDE